MINNEKYQVCLIGGNSKCCLGFSHKGIPWVREERGRYETRGRQKVWVAESTTEIRKLPTQKVRRFLEPFGVEGINTIGGVVNEVEIRHQWGSPKPTGTAIADFAYVGPGEGVLYTTYDGIRVELVNGQDIGIGIRQAGDKARVRSERVVVEEVASKITPFPRAVQLSRAVGQR